MQGSFRLVMAASTLWLLAVSSPASAQQAPDQPQPPAPTQPTPPPVAPPPARPTPEAPPEPTPTVVVPSAPKPVTTPEEPFRAPGGVGAVPFFRGPDFFNPPPPRGWVTLTPSIAIAEEYNDNLDLVSRGKTDDFITTIVPGLTLSMQQPEYQLNAGYSFSAALYAEDSDRNSVARSQQLFINALYHLSPRVNFTLDERFLFDRESNIVSTSGISSGFRDSYRNTVTPALSFQATPTTSLNLFGSYTLQRFQGNDPGAQDADTYRVGVVADHQFTPRFSGNLSVSAGYIDVERESPATTFTPQIGFGYQVTRTLSARVYGGATATWREDESTTTITPSGGIGFEQTFKYGGLSMGYDRAVTGESTGVSDTQTAFALLRLATLRRDLQVEVAPAYSHVEDVEVGGDKFDTYRVDLRFVYQLAPSIALTGGYSWYRQKRTGQADIDQNRVYLGLQYAYPINID